MCIRDRGYYFYSRRGLPGAVTLYNPLSDETLLDENTCVQAAILCVDSRKGELLAVTGGRSAQVTLHIQFAVILESMIKGSFALPGIDAGVVTFLFRHVFRPALREESRASCFKTPSFFPRVL